MLQFPCIVLKFILKIIENNPGALKVIAALLQSMTILLE